MAEEAKGEEEKGKGKKKSAWDKYKTWFILGGVIIVGVLYFAIKKSNANSNAAANPNTGVQGGIDPATGYLYGSPADTAALGGGGNSSEGGPPGPAGPPGPVGPPGPAGAPGKVKPGGGNPPPPTHVGGGPFPPTHHSSGYTVVSGDSLFKIAQRFYNGNGNAWTRIYNANRGVIGGNPNLIHPGQRLVIPT